MGELTDCHVFSACVSQFCGHYASYGERAVRDLFTRAVEQQPSIVFIDEIDSMCKDESESDYPRRIRVELLVQMNFVDSRVAVIGATNRPWDLDAAMLRRFPVRIMTKMPEQNVRLQFMKEATKGVQPCVMSEEDLSLLAELTAEYSFADLKTLTQEAMIVPVRRIQSARRFRKDAEGYLVPTTPDDPEGFDATLEKLNDTSQLRLPALTKV